jgi:hypothetical protein
VSSIASLYVVKNDDLPAIVSAAGAARTRAAIRECAKELDEKYGWSGYVMLNVLASLDAVDIVLASPGWQEASDAINVDYDYTALIAPDAKGFLDRLDPAAHEPGDLLDGPIEVELDDEEARYAMEETLSLLRDTIAGLSGDEVLLLHIG